jgi:hypothetical protein
MYVISCISAGIGRMDLKIHISILQTLGLVVIIIIIIIIIIITISSRALGGPWPLLFFFRFHNKFLWGEVVSLMPNPQPVGPRYPFSSGSSLLTCLAWEALAVAKLPPAHLSGSYDRTSPTTASK